MKQIKILLSSVLTLLLITGNNAYAAPHYSDFNGRPGFKANKPNMNVFKGQVRKGNVNAFKGQVRKGNAFTDWSSPQRNVRILPNKGRFNALNMPFNSNVRSGGNNTCVENIVGGTMCSARKGGAKTQIKFRGQEGQSFSRGLHNNGAFRERESGFVSGGFSTEGGGVGYNCKDAAGNNASNGNCIDKSTPKFGGQEGEAFNPTSKYSISDEPVIIPSPKKMHDSVHCVNPSNCLDKSTSEFTTTTLSGIVSTGGVHAVNDNDSRITFPDDLGPPGIVSGTSAHAVADSSTGADLSPSVNDNDSRIVGATGANGVQQPKGVQLKFIEGEWR